MEVLQLLPKVKKNTKTPTLTWRTRSLCDHLHLPSVVFSSTVEQGFCSNPWIPYNGNCFHLNRSPQTWSNAQKECRKEGGDLVSVHNVEEQSFVISQLGFGTQKPQNYQQCHTFSMPFLYCAHCPVKTSVKSFLNTIRRSHTFCLSAASNDELWIGFNDIKTEGLFDWSDQSSVSFTSWTFGKPAVSTDAEDCVLITGEVREVM